MYLYIYTGDSELGINKQHDCARGSFKKKVLKFGRIQTNFTSCMQFKKTVRIILNDPPCKDSNARFTTVPLKP